MSPHDDNDIKRIVMMTLIMEYFLRHPKLKQKYWRRKIDTACFSKLVKRHFQQIRPKLGQFICNCFCQKVLWKEQEMLAMHMVIKMKTKMPSQMDRTPWCYKLDWVGIWMYWVSSITVQYIYFVMCSNAADGVLKGIHKHYLVYLYFRLFACILKRKGRPRRWTLLFRESPRALKRQPQSLSATKILR